MKQQLRLLERIRSHDPNFHEKEPDDVRRGVISVQRNIQNILATRQGSTILDEEIGIPEFTNMDMNISLNHRYEFELQIRKVIEKLEPRMSNIKVSMEGVKDPVEGFHFRIEGVLGGDHPVNVGFDTIVNGEGKIFLRDVNA